jgi:hypothetical protein
MNLSHAVEIVEAGADSHSEEFVEAAETLASAVRAAHQQEPVWMMHRENGSLWSPKLSYPKMRPDQFIPLYGQRHISPEMWLSLQRQGVESLCQESRTQREVPDDDTERQWVLDAASVLTRLVLKVEAGKARSVQTYAQSKALLERLKHLLSEHDLLELDLVTAKCMEEFHG